ncbi:type III-B CRISPR module-associated protein Cmr3 [Nocardiopsis dassonvillei]|uniref:type III-B CRISPR module-associated protein Cmr3 n=1 Tax=Nocardiopsis dassonvillei TaxID=2014 RepID=UPI00200C56B4|nr:type III-B CRISPR module-associated protein Cmr3 [Nocardiopsis dassonvillei]MCK9874106.1 type III-B CRISPR module-associated protein Cmr3 [Nocardiopsis dassonvillei]
MTDPDPDHGDGARWVWVEPVDTVHVRDGRSFDAGEHATAHTVRPRPSTVAGALGKALPVRPRCVRGPLLVHTPASRRAELYFPAPADLLTPPGLERQEVWRLSVPAEDDPHLSGVTTDLHQDTPGVRPPVAPARARDCEPLTGWVSAAALAAYLSGDLFRGGRSQDSGSLGWCDPVSVEPRVGLARQNRTAQDGMLYRTTHLRLEDGWGFAAQYVPGSPAPPSTGPVPFGGQGRLARITPIKGLSWPGEPPEGHASEDEGPSTVGACSGGRLLVYVATPGIWARGWLPDLPEGVQVVSACVPEPETVATASPNSTYREFLDSRALYRAVPAGSVYHLQFPTPAAAVEWARAWHGRALPAARPDLDTAGFGVVLTGVWS